MTQFNLMLSLVLHFLSIMTGTDTEHRVVLLHRITVVLTDGNTQVFLELAPPLLILQSIHFAIICLSLNQLSFYHM